MRRALLIAALGFVAALACVAANPSPERHRDAISEAITARSPLAGALGLGFLKSHFPKYRSWLVCSFTTLDGRLTSAGTLGQVWINHRALEER